MAAARQSINDFIRDVGARTSGTIVYAASLNADNVTVKITRNGVVVWAKVLWPGTGSAAITDAGGQNQDTVDLFDGAGFFNAGSASAFINSLV
jgi:hypothetical protein